MHDLDRTTRETELEMQEFSNEQLGYLGEAESIGENLAETMLNEAGFNETYNEVPLNESVEMELAAELLEITNETELDRFFGGLFRRIGGAAMRFAKSPAGQAIFSNLKTMARKALPNVGKTIGTALGGQSAGNVGANIGKFAGTLFELELEGLSPEDQEFEVAKRYVRFANSAIRNAVAAPSNATPKSIVNTALIAAAKKYAPGLVRQVLPRRVERCTCGKQISTDSVSINTPSVLTAGNNMSIGANKRGTWIRRGQHIVVLGA